MVNSRTRHFLLVLILARRALFISEQIQTAVDVKLLVFKFYRDVLTIRFFACKQRKE